MEIHSRANNPTFGLKIVNNQAFRDVLGASHRQHRFLELDNLLNDLLHIEGKDILIIHGIDNNNKMYSTFTCGESSVCNNTIGCKTPAEASLRGLFDLVNKNDPKLMVLLKGKVKRFISDEEIIERYTTKQ